ncbi:hypothetical protein [Methylomarinum vadi]|uniref:hypothetical protein n=1 Tax=Methylomarinum vadi TaxID=438855 RepID=UPI0004DEEFBD|nr:hypothetical protein [Methylomarinum vadi]
MINVNDPNTVHEWINQKQRLETQLSWELLEIFNSNTAGLIDHLRIMAREVLDELRELKRSSPIASAAVTQAWQSQINIVQLCKKYPAGFNSIQVEQLDAQDCSDLIRLYGEFIEKGGALGARGAAGPRGDYSLQDSIKSSYRGGSDRWNKNPAAGYGRQRTSIQPGLQSTSDVHSFLISQQGGAARFKLLDKSTVNRVDQVFGLVPLADISGTTTDSIYFMERFAIHTGGDPVFQLLPLATIVAGGHHSLLEVALSLTINRIVDYRIGFYTTLFPAMGRLGAGRIRSVLTTAQEHHHNRHMLVYYADGDNPSVAGVPSGCFLYERQDHWAFRDFAKCVEILDSFPFMPAWPNEAQLRDFCRARRLRTP